MSSPRPDLQTEYRALVRNARENEGKLQKFQTIELRLIGSRSFRELYGEFIDDYRTTFELDAVSLALLDPDHEIRRLVEDYELPAEHFSQLHLISSPTDRQRLWRIGNRPVLRAFDERADGWLFAHGAAPPMSVALVPLERRGEVIGCLNLGSRDAARYDPTKSTEFLERVAAVAGICVENTLNFHRLRTAGLTDPLTGVRNRRFLDERLFEELARSRRNQEPIAFLFIDIDHFKQVNDLHGHPSGDLVLQGVAKRIASSLRVTDILTRYGGEEFAVLQPGTDAHEAYSVAERVLESIASENFSSTDGRDLRLTVSIGVAAMDGRRWQGSLEEHCRTLTQLADSALLDAKRGGRNRIVRAPSAKTACLV